MPIPDDISDDVSPAPAREPPEDDAPLGDEGFELALGLDEEDDLDDSVASELEHGIDVAGEEPIDAEGNEPGLDVGATAFDPDLPEPPDEGDESGPVGEAEESELGDDEPFDSDETEGGSDRLDEFVAPDLPSLDAEADLDAGPDEEPIVLSSADAEEDALRRAELGWVEVPLPSAMPPCTVVAIERGGSSVLAGGAEVFAVDDAGVRHPLAANLEGAVTSLVPGAEPGAVLFTTAVGELFRVVPGKPGQEHLVAFRETETALPVRAPQMRLGGPTPSPRPAILLHVKDDRGTLFESTDQGTTWRRVELGGSVVCLSVGSPPLCLVDTGRAVRFFLSEASGGFTAVGAPLTGDTDSPSIGTYEGVAVVLAPGHGVSVSANHGASFETAGGCARATAVTAGRLGPRNAAFAALFDEASGRATLVWIDPVSADAFAIGTIEPGEDDDSDDLCRVDSLAWDRHTETLWAGGAFGLRRFRRPPSA